MLRQHAAQRLKIVEAEHLRQAKTREHEIVVAQVLPEVVEGAIVVGAIPAAYHRVAPAAGLPGETEASREIVAVRSVERIIAAPWKHQLRARDSLLYGCSLAQLYRRVLYPARINRRTEALIPHAEV